MISRKDLENLRLRFPLYRLNPLNKGLNCERRAVHECAVREKWVVLMDVGPKIRGVAYV